MKRAASPPLDEPPKKIRKLTNHCTDALETLSDDKLQAQLNNCQVPLETLSEKIIARISSIYAKEVVKSMFDFNKQLSLPNIKNNAMAKEKVIMALKAQVDTIIYTNNFKSRFNDWIASMSEFLKNPKDKTTHFPVPTCDSQEQINQLLILGEIVEVTLVDKNSINFGGNETIHFDIFASLGTGQDKINIYLEATACTPDRGHYCSHLHFSTDDDTIYSDSNEYTVYDEEGGIEEIVKLQADVFKLISPQLGNDAKMVFTTEQFLTFLHIVFDYDGDGPNFLEF